jgi:tRNA (uracil-5-)-methyltransferase
MTCDYFGECGGCNLFNLNYKEQLEYKINREQGRFKKFYSENFEIFESPDGHHRARVEFRISLNKETNNLTYAMSPLQKEFKNQTVKIKNCKITDIKIYDLMPNLIDEVNQNEELKKRLFSVEFLSTEQSKILVTLIYHKKLSDNWLEEAKKLESKFDIFVIGRSRKQKLIVTQDFLETEINNFKFKVIENSFSQPNREVNKSMINWALNQAKTIQNQRDLLELYCGAGNFTLPFSQIFNRVLATEVSKNSIKLAKEHVQNNNISNIDFLRLSSEEFVEAINRVREFNRIKEANLDIFEFDFSTIFVDPPRSGLDETTLKLAQNFDNIIYISCNPVTLYENLENLTETHKIKSMAVFDQFPFTEHLEMGVLLEKI